MASSHLLFGSFGRQPVKPWNRLSRCSWPMEPKPSATIYSLAETAKANKLKIYEYLKHLLTEIPKHMDETNMDFLEDLLPWSKKLPAECHKKT